MTLTRLLHRHLHRESNLLLFSHVREVGHHLLALPDGKKRGKKGKNQRQRLGGNFLRERIFETQRKAQKKFKTETKRTRCRFTGVSVERASARSNMASSDVGATVETAGTCPAVSVSCADSAVARRCSSSCR